MGLWVKLCWSVTLVVYVMFLSLDSSQLKQIQLWSCFAGSRVLLSLL